MLGAVAPIGLRLAGSAVPALAAGLGLTMGVPAAISNIRGRQTGYNNPVASGVPGALMAGTTGFGTGGLLGGGLSALAYKQGREAGKKKRIENTLYDKQIINQYGETYNPLAKDFQQRRIDLRYIPRPINTLPGGMGTSPMPMGNAMNVANAIYGTNLQ